MSRPSSQFVSLAEAARYLSVSPDSIRRRIAEGKLPAFRVGPRNVRVRIADLDALLERIPTVESGR